MAQPFDVTQIQSKLWTPLHIRTTKQTKNINSNRTQICSPEQTCDIYKSVLENINSDNNTLKQLIDNIEIEQKCLLELLKDEPHWMGLINGTQRKLMHCAMNLEIMLLSLQQQTEHNANDKTADSRPRTDSNQSSQNSSNSMSKSTSVDGKILDTEGKESSIVGIILDVPDIPTIKVPDIGITHYAFSVKKVNTKFWSTTARLLHIDLKKKDVFITYNTHKNNKHTDDLSEEKSVSSVTSPDNTLRSKKSTPNSSDDDGTTCTSSNNKPVSMAQSLSLSAMQVTRSSRNDEPVTKLVDLFRDPHNMRLQAVLVFKCLKTQEKEHDKLVFKSYTFNSECELIKCESLIYNHILNVKQSNRRIINTRKIANIQIDVHLDDSATRGARKLVKMWLADASKDKILQISDCDPKRIRLWMTTNAKFIAMSTIKIFIMLGCIITKHNKAGRMRRSSVMKENNDNDKILNDAELRWLATSASRHVYAVWRDRDKINNQCNSKMVYDNYQFSTDVVKYEQLSINDKNRLIQETSVIIDHLIKDQFQINIPKQVQPFMF